ncbi:MAG: FAD-binding oxidoreductase, partial [Cyanobacteria bacterium P01_H01_bin.119]
EQDSACWQTIADQISRPDERDRLLIKFGLLPNAAVDWFTQIEAVIHQSWAGRIHIGSGLGLLSIDPDAKNDKNLADMLIKLRSQCEARRGFLTLLQAPSEVKARVSVWGTPSGLPLMRQIKQQFDAKNLLGPGRFVT